MIERFSVVDVVNQIGDVFDNHAVGLKNDTAIRELQMLVRELRTRSKGFVPIGDKLASIEAWAGIVFSERKHKKCGGVDRVLYLIRNDLGVLHDLVLRNLVEDRGETPW